MASSICPKCENTIGFYFGTCITCGWNYISNEWTVIKVDPNRIPPQFRQQLIDYHAKQYDRKIR